MLPEVGGFLNLPGTVLFFDETLYILWKRSHVAEILTLASTSCLLTENRPETSKNINDRVTLDAYVRICPSVIICIRFRYMFFGRSPCPPFLPAGI